MEIPCGKTEGFPHFFPEEKGLILKVFSLLSTISTSFTTTTKL